MTPNSIEADYLIVGAGAAGMAFADTILTDTNARILMVDRHHRPAGTGTTLTRLFGCTNPPPFTV